LGFDGVGGERTGQFECMPAKGIATTPKIKGINCPVESNAALLNETLFQTMVISVPYHDRANADSFKTVPKIRLKLGWVGVVPNYIKPNPTPMWVTQI
jgi:hypothetical protein